ncbi:MAG: thiopurine S-methyltransferase [Steroidobacteraceae bacterium]
MQAEFWHERWATGQTGFHEAAANPLLTTHASALALPRGARVFLPLCGKTLDIDWLLGEGHRVVGAELSAIAVGEVFARLKREATIDQAGAMQKRSAPGLDVFVGDFFALTADSLGVVDAVYDRAALIALPSEMRRCYAAHLTRITRGAPQLLVALEYDQQAVAGPPFSVEADEVRALYGDRKPRSLARHTLAGGLKGKVDATEQVWLLASSPECGSSATAMSRTTRA